MKLKGIYKIENKINGKVYIGQSADMNTRWWYHKKDLFEGKHHQKNLQKDFDDMVNIAKAEGSDNEYYRYISFKNVAIDKYYTFEPLLLLDYYDKDTVENIEDEYILNYRDKQEGYSQYTNKEIREYRNEKDRIYKEKREAWDKLNKAKKESLGLYFSSMSTDLYLKGDDDLLIIDGIKFLSHFSDYYDKKRLTYLAYFINEKSKRYKRNEYEFKIKLSDIVSFSLDFKEYICCSKSGEDMFLKNQLTCKDLKELFKTFNKGLTVLDVKINNIKSDDEITIRVNREDFNSELFRLYKNMIVDLDGFGLTKEYHHTFVDKNNSDEVEDFYYHFKKYTNLKE